MGVTIPDAGWAVIAPEMLALYVQLCIDNLRFYFNETINELEGTARGPGYSVSDSSEIIW